MPVLITVALLLTVAVSESIPSSPQYISPSSTRAIPPLPPCTSQYGSVPAPLQNIQPVSSKSDQRIHECTSSSSSGEGLPLRQSTSASTSETVTIPLLPRSTTISTSSIAAINTGTVSPSLLSTIPCTSAGTPPGCNPTRIKPCGSYTGYPIIASGSNSGCYNIPQSFHRGDTYIVQFNAGIDGECLEILMRVGECWGVSPLNNQDYGCNGRCGPGCGENSVCSNWARDCLKHDVCSWYFGSSGGPLDANCGDEFDQAVDDWLTNCLGDFSACELMKPLQSSVCCSAAVPDDGIC